MKRTALLVACILVPLVCSIAYVLTGMVCDVLDTNDSAFACCVGAIAVPTILVLFACMRSSQISACERRAREGDNV